MRATVVTDWWWRCCRYIVVNNTYITGDTDVPMRQRDCSWLPISRRETTSRRRARRWSSRLCFIETELQYCRSKFYIAEIGIFDFFVPVTLTLTRMPSNMNLTHIPSTHTGCATVNFLCWGFRKLSYYRLYGVRTDILTPSKFADGRKYVYRRVYSTANNRNIR